MAPVGTGGTLAAVTATLRDVALGDVPRNMVTTLGIQGAETGLLLGDDLIVWVLLALGGALFAGNVMALVRPPERPRQEGELEQAPKGRSIFMAAIGFVVAMAALGALVT